MCHCIVNGSADLSGKQCDDLRRHKVGRMKTETTAPPLLVTNIPQRLDRLPWSRWHWLIVAALGITWILDGLEVTIVAALAPTLKLPTTLHLTDSQVGLTVSAYLAGSVIGAMVFSYLADRQGRKRWFLITLVLYLTATVLSAFSWDLWSFLCFRFLAGAGIGGEYSAINSAIDELIPARARGQTDLAINGSWWIGTAAGALISIPLLDSHIVPEWLGWRLCFGLGGILGLGILLVRRLVPESPRWLITHGRLKEAEAIVVTIEEQVKKDKRVDALPEPAGSMTIHANAQATFKTVVQQLVKIYPTRTMLGVTLMVTQSVLYNAIFFTYPLVLTKFSGVSPSQIGLYLVPFAIGNFLGPLLLGRFFDTIGRKPMIALTYATSGLLLACTGYLFWKGYLTPVTQTLAWSIIFFFASAGASSAYLTVSEIFPLEIRAMAIAVFFVVGQVPGALAPWLFSMLIQNSPTAVLYGDLVAAALMLLGAVVALVFGVKAEQKPLEALARPLSAAR
ncbi:MAG: putative MFS-type transporter [Nitrospira sp.]|nr:putative MFS-type transporter [Nitrospira sp.]